MRFFWDVFNLGLVRPDSDFRSAGFLIPPLMQREQFQTHPKNSEESKTFKKTDQIRFFNWSNQFRSERLADRRVRQTLSISSARYDLESFPQGL